MFARRPPLLRRLPALIVAAFAASFWACGGETREESATPADAPWRFSDVTEAAGLGSFRHETGAFGQLWMPESTGSGAAFTDYDGDGWIDIVLVAGGFLEGSRAFPALRLYRNNGNGTFSDRTREAGLADVVAYGQGLTAVDFDGDGDDDLFLTALGPNVLLRNDGGVFYDVSEESGLSVESEWSTAAAFLDADGDGHLDLFVGNYVHWTPETDAFCSEDGVTKRYCTPKAYRDVPGRFYRNNGDGTFTERTAEAGFGGAPGSALGAVSLDIDRDGLTDLYVANDLRPNLFFRNNGDGTFTEVALRMGAAYDERGYARAGMGVDAGVVDASGHVTIFIGNFSREPIGAFQYTGDDLFLSREAAMRLYRPSLNSLTFALFLFDANLDGHLDILGVNGHVDLDVELTERDVTYRQPVQLFLNQGDGTFRNVAPELGAPLTTPLAGRGGGYADFDGDGDLDVLVTENGGGVHLWRNDLPSGHGAFLRVVLEGTRSNRAAIGARVIVHVGGLVIQLDRRGGASYLTGSEPLLTFGLGDATRADSLIVHWPSGLRTSLAGVAADQTIFIREEP